MMLQKFDTQYGMVFLNSYTGETNNKTYYNVFCLIGGKSWDFTTTKLASAVRRFGKNIERINDNAGYKVIDAPMYM